MCMCHLVLHLSLLTLFTPTIRAFKTVRTATMNPLFAIHYLRVFVAVIHFHEDGLMSFMYNFETHHVWLLSGG